MSNVVKGLFGGGAQEKLLKRQSADLKATEAGQRKLREGGRGLLAFTDDDELGSTLGGSRQGLLQMLGSGGAHLFRGTA